MNSPQELKKAIKNLRIPDASDHDLTTEEGVTGHRADWKMLENQTDDLVKDIVRSNALSAFGAHSKLASRVMKHLEKWRLHAQATTDLWNRTWEWKAINEEPDAYDSFLGWLGVKAPRRSWISKEGNQIQRLTERLGKAHTVLFREYELLLVEFDAVV